MKLKIKSQNYSNRQLFIPFVLLIIFAFFCYKIIKIHSTEINTIKLNEKAYLQSQITQTTKYSRGNIIDRNGNILATNLVRKQINLDPTLIQNEFIPLLAKALKIPYSELKNKIEKKRQADYGRKYLIIVKDLTIADEIIKNIEKLKKQKIKICVDVTTKANKTNFEIIKEFFKKDDNTDSKKDCNNEKISGVAIESSNIRYYPKANTMSALLGKTNKENIGVFGVEGEFDYLLQSTDGKYKLSAAKKDSNIYYKKQIIQTEIPSADIQLTIDSDIQFYVFEAIKKSVEFHLADSASAIVLSKDGEILAMANYPSTNPNKNNEYNPQHYRNRVLSDKFEPASTMKTFTMLLALDKGVITATDDELIDVTTSVRHIKSDSEARKYGDAITIRKILQKSHNLGTVQVMQRLNSKEVYQTWKKLGFGEYLNIMPNIENPGLLKHYSNWGITDKITIAYGHGPMNANLAQLARAYLVFANNGSIPTLKLLKEPYTTEKIQVFSKTATNTIKEILDSVASLEGSGYRSIINGYEIAGKTGTAEMVIDGKYDEDGAKNTYFVGFSPVTNPKYIMAVRIENPKQCFTSWNPNLKDSCEGSNSAAITFKNAMEKILNIDTKILPTK